MLLLPDEQIRSKIVDGQTFERLLILPDGALARFPFEALVVEPDAVNPLYLLDRGPTTVYAPSASMYYNLKQRKTESGRSQTLTVGNPDYALKRTVKPTDTLSEMRGTRRAARMGTLSQLEWTEKETQWIEESSKKNSITVTRLNLAQSTEENVRKNVAGRKIVHLACHGLAEDDTGNSLFSALALTIGDPNDPKNDGFLELAEMFGLDLKSCELAVLSACDTNLGPNQHGEGTWSMGRGMLASGAKRVVTTNWQVADDASAFLTYHFIDKVNSSPSPDHAASLRQAKREIRNDSEHSAWRHPYYWAPFVLMGPN
jgi:CHAT domain-containing protein